MCFFKKHQKNFIDTPKNYREAEQYRLQSIAIELAYKPTG
ncbi:hypothetical protein CAXC1_110012 [Candidatus Xenohaliotis californiensis]|uniref:Uncharacterized protein n=1 Tax=Candidatus Xenohaliotis californiensis TaxID=84677 RepID=A0ABP0EUC3_9RICK|nr:hypothetical protein CAXC1_110012 [Candidatus Xenohaliotis californiensis]